MTIPQKAKKIYVVDGIRTPFLKASGQSNGLSAADLGVVCAQQLLLKQSFALELIDELIVGCVGPLPNEANIARIIGLRLGLSPAVPAWTVQRNCASGLQALDSAVNQITLGRADVVLAGGTEAMSHAPLLYQSSMADWLASFKFARRWQEKIANIIQFRPRYLRPVISLMEALKDPVVGINMGQTAEKLSDVFGISREEMDTYACQSHERAIAAESAGYFSNRFPMFDQKGGLYTEDTGVRSDSTLKKLSKLKPVFERPFGKITAGNSSQISDGSAFLILASEEAVQKNNLPVLGTITQTSWAGLDPSIMGLGPVHAISALLKRECLSMEQIDFWEINEAFAGQVLACIKAMQDDVYCQKNLERQHALGALDLAKLNIDGGAIALGHPVGATGARIVLHLFEVLKRHRAKRGVASLCIGGGQGGAVLLEGV